MFESSEGIVGSRGMGTGWLARVAGWLFAEASGNSAEARRRARTLPKRLVITSILCDAVVIIYMLLLSYWIRFGTALQHIGVPGTGSMQDYAGHFALAAISLLFTANYFGIYDPRTLLRYRFVSMQVIKTCLVWTCAFLALTLIFKAEPLISRIYVGVAGITTMTGLIVWRFLFHSLLHHSHIAEYLRQRILFVGWSDDAQHLATMIARDRIHPYELVGYVPASRPNGGNAPREVARLGNLEEIEQIIEREMIDIVLLADVDTSNGDPVALANLCEREMVQFKVIPSFFQILLSGLRLETVSGVPVLGVTELPLDNPINILCKRLVDILGATVGLILSAPIIAVFGTLVWLESPGPIFYRQRRLGQNGTPFWIIKIRSMRLDAEAQGTPGWTTQNDPRRLRIGALMRRLNIDEVPQFWNVLKGEMSLVGPRPERPELIRNFKHDIPHYNARHAIKPGITGWAQVKGLRGDTDLTERIRSDLYYLENWSLLLDLHILLLTFVNRKNAC
jgi:exopolysaccharide biosynthesis polyprenyl glycosylphosphotransferase